MKRILIALVCGGVLAGPMASGETRRSTTTTTTVRSSGVISEYVPGRTFVVKETRGPVRYRHGKQLVYVTKSGKALTDPEIRSYMRVGSPVHVHYVPEGDERVISRIEVDDD